MKRRGAILWVGLTLLFAFFFVPATVAVESAPALSVPPGLSFLELKVTGDEFVVLQNNTGADIPDLSRFALYYFNNVSPLSPGTSTSSQMLPAVSLPADASIALSATPRQTCGASVAGDLALSLGDSAGFLQVVELSTNQMGAVIQTAGDVVSWSSGASGMIPAVPSNSKDPLAVYYRYSLNDSYTWQYANLSATNPCELNAVIMSGATKVYTPVDAQLIDSSDVVPGIIVKLAGSLGAASGPSMPAGNMGLKAPKISELLPNVKAPAKDADDEFIELYNPNDKVFELSGFILQTGSTTSETRHNFTIPKGIMIPAKGHKTFYSRETGLSLSNTGGQAWILDPFGSPIGHSDPYSKPKDGSAWASAGGKWYYTITPTPNAPNKVTEPTTTASGSTSKTAKTSKGVPVATVAATSGGVTGASSATAYEAAASTIPVHPTTLAIVLGLGLLYLSYEYRHDLANKIHQFRANRARRG